MKKIESQVSEEQYKSVWLLQLPYLLVDKENRGEMNMSGGSLGKLM